MTTIPIGARILSVVDCFDALTSDRPYRPAMTTAQALAIVIERRGTMYDPKVVDAFLELLPTLRAEGGAEPELQRAVTRIRDAAVTEPTPMPAGGDGRQMAAVSVVDSLVRVASGAPRAADLVRLIAPELRAQTPGAEFIVYLASSTGQRLVARATSGDAGARRPGHVDRGGRTGERLGGRQPAAGRQLRRPPRPGPLAQSAALTYCLATPLVDGDRVVGVLSGYAPAPFSDDAVRQLATLAPRLAPMLALASDADDAAPRPTCAWRCAPAGPTCGWPSAARAGSMVRRAEL